MKRIQFAMVVLTGTALLSAGCGSGGDTPGTGGKGGSGAAGAKGSGGAVGTGGSSTGGAVGTGGSSTGGSSTGGSSTGGSSTGGSNTGGSDTGGSATGGSAGQGGAAGGSAGHGGGSAGHGGAAGAAGGSAGHGGAAGAAGGSAGEGGHAGAAGGAGGAAGAGGGGGAGGTAPDPVVARGGYLFNSVLGCAGCHTPTNGTSPSGRDCFVSSGSMCLSAPNLTNDDTGLKMLTDAKIKDAFTKGIDPEDATKYLFATMPYYQFKNLSDSDANAIVAYLRTVPGVAHTVAANTAPYDVQPSTPEWQAVLPGDLPAGSQAAGPANGKYLATLACATCHTVEISGANPKRIDPTKAFQGGKVVTATVNSAPKMVEAANLTPDATGLMTWNASQIANTIKTARGKDDVTPLCGMRALAGMTLSDATDIGTYLLTIPAKPYTRIMTCAP